MLTTGGRRRRAGRAIATAIAVAIVVSACTSTSRATPEITAIDATSGPAGSVVLLRGSALGLSSPDVQFDGVAVPAQGSDTRAVFTVPYDATTGAKDVTVVFDGRTSAPVQFEVTGPADGVAPTLTAASIRYHSIGPAATDETWNLVVFGTGLDTLTTLSVDGTEIPTFHPARPLGSLIDVLATGYVLQGLPTARFRNVLAGRLGAGAATIPAGGTTISVVARNASGSSAPLSVDVPDQDILVEFDRIDDGAVTWPPAGVWRDSTLNTLGRSYTGVGLITDQRLDDTVADPQMGAAFSDADVANFRAAIQDLDDDAFPGEWYVHASLVSTRVEPVSGFTTFGRMDDSTTRSSLVMFVPSLTTDARYLRSLIHEMGHALNLLHCEGDGTVSRSGSGATATITPNMDGTTIMNQTRNLAPSWGYAFSGASRTHITTHPATEVAPGAGNLALGDSARQEGTCDY